MMKDVTNQIFIFILKNIENNQFFEKIFLEIYSNQCSFFQSLIVNIFIIDLINYYIAKI